MICPTGEADQYVASAFSAQIPTSNDGLAFKFLQTEILVVIDAIRTNYQNHDAGNQHIPTIPTLLEYAPRWHTRYNLGSKRSAQPAGNEA
jgi:hypothetical protein